MDSKHVKYIVGQVLVSVPYCTDWSFFLFLRAAHGIKGGRRFSKRQGGFGRTAQGIAYFR